MPRGTETSYRADSFFSGIKSKSIKAKDRHHHLIGKS